MNVTIPVRLSGGSASMRRFASFLTPGEKREILRALGAKFKYLTIQNLGLSGKDRPHQWQRLSPRYAKRVNRTDATLYLTGELMRSLRVSEPTENSVEVYTDSPYAEAHQNGSKHLPARPFFPVNPDGTPTARTRRILETTAAQELQRQMRRLL